MRSYAPGNPPSRGVAPYESEKVADLVQALTAARMCVRLPEAGSRLPRCLPFLFVA